MNKITLNEEIIDGHLVTRDVKKLWTIELNIYKEFKRICDKHGLKYCAYSGTLLGVVRHHGSFIPWDDDIDVCMPFNDYCRFKEIAKTELNERYFFQSYETENGFSPLNSRIRDTKTTMITSNDSHYPNWNKGVFLDIFPEYKVSDNLFFESLHKALICISYLFFLGKDITIRQRDNTSIIKKIIKIAAMFSYYFMRIFFSSNHIISWVEKTQNLFKNKNTNKVRNYLSLFTDGFNSKKSIYPSDIFENMLIRSFYDTEIYIPKEFAKILASSYGNWQEFVKDGSVHTLVSYTIDEEAL